MSADEDDEDPPGLSEAAGGFGDATAVKDMDDATLLRSYHLLSNIKVVRPPPVLEAIEREVRARGLSTTH